LRGLLRGKRFTTRDQSRINLAARDHVAQTIDAPLRHVSARVSVDQPSRIRRTKSGGQ
jgi:aspartate oxidase